MLRASRRLRAPPSQLRRAFPLISTRRNVSSTPPPIDEQAAAAIAVVEPPPLTWWPSDLALAAVDHVHLGLGLPWWISVGTCTVFARFALLPIALHGSRQQAKMQGMRAELAPLQARIQASGGQDAHAAAEMHALYARHGVSPLNLIALPLLQMPVFMSFFFGLRRLAEAFPDAKLGGAYWFTDLGMTDETMCLPFLSAGSALLLVRLSVPGAQQGMSEADAAQADFMKRVLTGVTLVSLPVASTMPASVLCFWVTNNAFSLVYTSLMRTGAVRGALGLPPMPLPRDPNATDADGGVGAAMEAGTGLPPIQPVNDPSAVNKAQIKAAESLSTLAGSLVDGGKLDEAITMQLRSVAIREVARDAKDAPVDAEAEEQLRDALWRLVEMQQEAERLEDAIGSLERWRDAGGDAERFDKRMIVLTAVRPGDESQSPPESKEA